MRKERVRYTDDSDQYEAMCQIIEDLQNGTYDKGTLEDAVEIITEVAKREIRETKGYFANLISHVLKWEYQPNRRTPSWINTVEDSLEDLEDIFNDSKSTENKIREIFDQVYKRAKRRAESETGIKMPDNPPYTFDQYMDAEFIKSIVNKDGLKTNSYYREGR